MLLLLIFSILDGICIGSMFDRLWCCSTVSASCASVDACIMYVNGMCGEREWEKKIQPTRKNTLKKSKSDVFTYYGMCTICDKKNERWREFKATNSTNIRKGSRRRRRIFFFCSEPIFWRGFFHSASLFYMFTYCSVFVPFPIMIWNENREKKINVNVFTRLHSIVVRIPYTL